MLIFKELAGSLACSRVPSSHAADDLRREALLFLGWRAAFQQHKIDPAPLIFLEPFPDLFRRADEVRPQAAIADGIFRERRRHILLGVPKPLPIVLISSGAGMNVRDAGELGFSLASAVADDRIGR